MEGHVLWQGVTFSGWGCWQGQTLVWCRKCPGWAASIMFGKAFRNRASPEIIEWHTGDGSWSKA